MSIVNYTTGSQGSFISTNPLDVAPYNQASPFGDNVVQLYSPNVVVPSEPQIKISMAISKIRPDNTRLIFATSELAFSRFKATSTGIVYDNFDFDLNNFTPPTIDQAVRTEMELIETTTGYRIVFSYPSELGITLFVGELDNNGDIITYQVKTLPKDVQFNSPYHPNIKGLEFSPNGQYLYVTHDPTNDIPIPFKIYEVATNNFIPLTNATMQTQIQVFKNSQIELGKDGKLYLANGTSLATIGNSNDPYNLNWNNSAVPISYNLNDLGNNIPNIYEYIKLFSLPDQVDGMNYSDYFTEGSLECCINNTTFSTTTYSNEQSGTQNWTTSLNPFGNSSTITVQDELIIKSGANITATGLRFEFAPDAKLVVERGARFTINTCTLTVNTECETTAMWNGVEVQGPSNNRQLVDAGRFTASNSVIEHAYAATHNYSTAKGGPGIFWETGNRGGVIKASNTTFRNNHRATVFFEFQNKNLFGGPINDESRFDNCTFKTDAQLNKPNLTPTVIMAHLFGVQGVNFYGCDFKNTASYTTIPYIERGSGIEAYNCLLTVTRICNTVYCTIQDRGNFTDLLRGIESISTSSKTTEVSYTNFTNNWRGIYLETVDLAKIIENNINVGAASNWGSSYGLYLNTCDGYTVENNTFNTNTTTQNGNVGVYVLNSGVNNNEIYRNTFDKFYIGSQAAEVNGNSVFGSGSKGLVFRCNTYTNGRDHDILISSGIINQTHGFCSNAQTPSNNRFSYTTQYGDFWHVDLTKNISYQFSQPNGYNLAPRNYMATPPNPTHYNDLNTYPTICGSYNFNPSVGCPDRINSGGSSQSLSGGYSPQGLNDELQEYSAIIKRLEEELSKIDVKDTAAIKEQEETIAYYNATAEKAKNNLLSYYLLNESVEEPYKEILPFMEQETNPHKQMRFYLAAKMYDKADDLLVELSSKKTFAAFTKLYGSLLELEQSNNLEKELKTNKKLLQKITELADTQSNTYEKAIASSLLKRAGLRNDLESIEILNMSSARRMNQSNDDIRSSNSISVYPNPTSNEVNITHNLSPENGKVMFKVYNMLGVEVINETLTSTNNEVKVNNLKSGVYFYTITQNNQTIKTDKLMVK